MTITNKREQIWQSLNDYEYRHQFIEEEINVGIAFQIRSLRNRKDLRQEDLATLMNVKQPLVSSWENPNYGKYTLGTLKGLAKAFDVGLLVRFVPFSKLADWAANLTHDDIAPPTFEEEQSYIPPPASSLAYSDYSRDTMLLNANNTSSYDPDKTNRPISSQPIATVGGAIAGVVAEAGRKELAHA